MSLVKPFERRNIRGQSRYTPSKKARRKLYKIKLQGHFQLQKNCLNQRKVRSLRNKPTKKIANRQFEESMNAKK